MDGVVQQRRAVHRRARLRHGGAVHARFVGPGGLDRKPSRGVLLESSASASASRKTSTKTEDDDEDDGPRRSHYGGRPSAAASRPGKTYQRSVNIHHATFEIAGLSSGSSSRWVVAGLPRRWPPASSVPRRREAERSKRATTTSADPATTYVRVRIYIRSGGYSQWTVLRSVVTWLRQSKPTRVPCPNPSRRPLFSAQSVVTTRGPANQDSGSRVNSGA